MHIKSWLLPLGAAALLMAGCAQPAPPTTAPAAPAAAPAAPVQPQAHHQAENTSNPECTIGSEQWRESADPIRGGTMVKAGGEFAHMDPSAPGRSGGIQASQVYNGLFEYRGCYYSDTAVVPKLVESWTVSADGRTWTLKLRNDVKWQNVSPTNGRAFTSADVAFTIDHQKDGGLLRALWADVEHSEPDAQTIVLTLPQPDADFLASLGHRTNVVVPKEVKDETGDFKTRGVGTGAYILKSFKLGQEIITVANPDYWVNGKDGQPLPYIPEVRTINFPDRAAEEAAFRTGQLDHSRFNGFTYKDAITVEKEMPKAGRYPQLVFSFQALWFNINKAPFDNAKVRRALGMAVNPDDILGSLGGPDAGVWAGFVPPFLTDYASTEAQVKENLAPDIEGAKALLKEAGFGPGELKPLLRTAGSYRQEAEVIQQNLKAIGVDANIEVEGLSFTPILQKQDFDIAWGATGGFLYANYWLADFLKTDASTNRIKLSDATVDGLIDAHSQELDVAKRAAIIAQLKTRLLDIMPYRPTVSNFYHHMVSCRLHNFRRTNPSYNMPMVVEAWLDDSTCK